MRSCKRAHLNPRIRSFRSPEFSVSIDLEADKVITIGRADESDVALRDSLVSRIHCQITDCEASSMLEDTSSHNGTYVNGERVERAEVHSGDVIEIGCSAVEIVSARPDSDPTDSCEDVTQHSSNA